MSTSVNPWSYTECAAWWAGGDNTVVGFRAGAATLDWAVGWSALLMVGSSVLVGLRGVVRCHTFTIWSDTESFEDIPLSTIPDVEERRDMTSGTWQDCAGHAVKEVFGQCRYAAVRWCSCRISPAKSIRIYPDACVESFYRVRRLQQRSECTEISPERRSILGDIHGTRLFSASGARARSGRS